MGPLDFDQLFEEFSAYKVAIVGDVMLDTYLWGNVDRISPEAPVPIVTLIKKDYRLGGAANVALNIRALNVTADIFSVIGDDEDGRLLVNLFEKEGIGTGNLLKSNKRVTTNKSRIISRSQHMLRMDAEITHDLDEDDERRLLDAIEIYLHQAKPQVLVLEDYNKGVLTDKVIRSVVGICNELGIITTVDPKRKNFFSYQDVSIFKPNLKEVREALNLISARPDLPSLDHIHGLLFEKLNHQVSLITLSENGVFYHGRETGIVPTHIRNISDVSGAGDTVIAVASLVYAATRNEKLMAEIANIAGGLVCEEVGTVAIRRERLVEECKELLGGGE